MNLLEGKRTSRGEPFAMNNVVTGFPLILPQSAKGANERIVYGHIGLGGMGSSHVVYDSCAALCDVDKNHMARHAKRFETPISP